MSITKHRKVNKVQIDSFLDIGKDMDKLTDNEQEFYTDQKGDRIG